MPNIDNYITEMRESFAAMQKAAETNNQALMDKAESAYAQAKSAADSAAAAEKSSKEFADRIDLLEASLKQMQLDGVAGAGKALNEYDKAFKAALRHGAQADVVALDKLARSCYAQLMETPNTAGGYLVQPEMAKEIIGAIRDYNIMREVCNVVTIGSNEYLVNAWPNGPTMNIAANDAAATANGATPAITQISIPVVDCDVTVPVTRDILADTAFDLEGFIASQAATGFGNGEMNAFTNGGGSGTRTIGGLFAVATADNSSNPAFGTAGFIASGSATGLTNADVLIDMISSLKSEYRRNASFMASSMTISAIRKLKKGSAADGYLIWTPSLVPGTPDLLLNKPLHENDYAPAIADGALPIAFGDFKRAYTIVDRQQMFLLVTVNATSKRVLDYTWFHRVGGGVTDSRAVKFCKISA